MSTSPGGAGDDLACASTSKDVAAHDLIERVLKILSHSWKPVESLSVATSRRHDAPVRYPYQPSDIHMTLSHYVRDILWRSQTDFVTLRTAIHYLEEVSALIPTVVSTAARDIASAMEGPPDSDILMPRVSTLLCPRRTFSASLLLSAKFIHDRAYSTRAWMALTGLSAVEVNECERLLYQALQYNLWPGGRDGGMVKREMFKVGPLIAYSSTP